MTEVNPELLKSFAFFAAFTAEQCQHIAANVEQVHYDADVALFHAGERSDKMYLITDGQVKITRSDEHGGEIKLGVLNSGEAFGELAMLSGEPRMASATTLTPCEFLVVDRAVMAHAIKIATPEDILDLLAVFSQQMREANEREFQDLLAKRVQELQHVIQQK